MTEKELIKLKRYLKKSKTPTIPLGEWIGANDDAEKGIKKNIEEDFEAYCKDIDGFDDYLKEKYS